jgi:hypothetical protein
VPYLAIYFALAGEIYGKKSLYLFCNKALFTFSEEAILTLKLKKLLGTEVSVNVILPDVPFQSVTILVAA